VLFYNHKHEFIGIDNDGLKLLNYTTLEDLLGVCSDAADLFAKEPGYIHNFKSFGWIDFLLHADSDARSAIVHANGRTFSCTLSVHSFYLCAEPSKNGYMIDMTHIQSISGEDVKPHIITPKIQYEIKPTLKETLPIPEPIIPSALPDYAHLTPTALSEPDTFDVPSFDESDLESAPEHIEEMYTRVSLPLSDEELNHDAIQPEPIAEPHIERPMLGDVHFSTAEQKFLDILKVDSSYRFDPNVAAHELGLPVDLIEEFIGDFIQQAYEFKTELFDAVLKGDTNNIKILSHKLKGVAANLRIEDAFETLSIVNTTNDPLEIEANLKYFYTIIEKLEGKEPTVSPIASNEIKAVEATDAIETLSSKEENVDDIYTFALKNEKTEPIHLEDLYEAPITLYENVTEDNASVEYAEEDPTAEELTQEEPEIVELPVQRLSYDKASITGQLGIELDFFDELLHEYKHDALKAGEEIGAAIAAFDTHAWQKTALHLKGISDNLRLNEISDELAILSQTNDAQEANKASKRLNSFLQQL
jgi:HPt (histidine-containing phosphotransfer) domain-containing protein